jgi:hypothetical protein
MRIRTLGGWWVWHGASGLPTMGAGRYEYEADT